MMNSERIMVELIEEEAPRQGIRVERYCADWMLRLSRNHVNRYIFGYNFDLNSSPTYQITNDKAATSAALGALGLPHVEHALFFNPSQMAAYVPVEGVWNGILKYAGHHSNQVVCKPHDGTGGTDVERAASLKDVEAIVTSLFKKYRCITLSPFLNIEAEYRAVVLDGVCELIFEKQRLVIVSDGRRPKLEQVLSNAETAQAPKAMRALLATLAKGSSDLMKIPPLNEEIVLDWRHNLALGARPSFLNENSPEWRSVADLALAATGGLNVRFGSVDVVKVDGCMMLLEVHCGVMMEELARSSPQGRAHASRIYAKALSAMFS
jgi:hypothetical protein